MRCSGDALFSVSLLVYVRKYVGYMFAVTARVCVCVDESRIDALLSVVCWFERTGGILHTHPYRHLGVF